MRDCLVVCCLAATFLPAVPVRAEPPTWAISGVTLGMGFDEAKKLLEGKGEVQVAQQAKSDGSGRYDRALVLYEPSYDRFNRTDVNSASTLVLFDESGGHTVTEVARRGRYVNGKRPSPESAASAVSEAYGAKLKPVTDFGRIKYAASILLDARGAPTTAPACVQETVIIAGGLSGGLVTGWTALDPACGRLLSITADLWEATGQPATVDFLHQHMIDTQASIADYRKKSDLRQAAEATAQSAARARADGIKPTL